MAHSYDVISASLSRSGNSPSDASAADSLRGAQQLRVRTTLGGTAKAPQPGQPSRRSIPTTLLVPPIVSISTRRDCAGVASPPKRSAVEAASAPAMLAVTTVVGILRSSCARRRSPPQE